MVAGLLGMQISVLGRASISSGLRDDVLILRLL